MKPGCFYPPSPPGAVFRTLQGTWLRTPGGNQHVSKCAIAACSLAQELPAAFRIPIPEGQNPHACISGSARLRSDACASAHHACLYFKRAGHKWRRCGDLEWPGWTPRRGWPHNEKNGASRFALLLLRICGYVAVYQLISFSC